MKTWIAIFAVVAQIFCLAGSGWARPFTRIVSPVQNQCVPGPDVTIKFEAGGMTLGPSAWNLHFMLDEEPFQIQYDGNHAHVFKNVRPGTHTVRVFAANAMHEAIPGTQSTVSFSVGYPDKANYVMPGQPTLTYNLPQGEYVGIDAADVTVDWLVENVTLAPGGYQVAYYADGRRFIVHDHCGPRHLKNLAPGAHRIRIELQNAFGDLVPGPFNSTERVIVVSPDQVVKSPSPVDDGYHGLPRLDSIKGSMTMGQHWSATAPQRPLTEAETERRESLTVLRGDGATVGLTNGENLTGGPAEVDQAITVEQPTSAVTEEIEEFSVRDTGEIDMEAVNLDTVEAPIESPDVEASTVRRGSIMVNSAESDDVDLETDAVIIENDDVDDSDAQSDTAVAQPTTARADATTRTTRRRADGSTTRLQQTTAPLQLEDRPGLRKADPVTTRTVRTADPSTTASRSSADEKATTGGQRAARRDRGDNAERRRSGQNGGKSTTAPPGPTLD